MGKAADSTNLAGSIWHSPANEFLAEGRAAGVKILQRLHMQDLDLIAPSVQWSGQAMRFLDNTLAELYKQKWRSQLQSEWGSKETKE